MTPPPRSSTPSQCTCFRLRRASRRVTQVYDHALAPVGLSLNQYSILRRSEREPRVLGELADELGMDRTTLTRNLSPWWTPDWWKPSAGATRASAWSR